jgi:hypothetical protein
MCLARKLVSVQGSKIDEGVNGFERVYGKVGKSIFAESVQHFGGRSP